MASLSTYVNKFCGPLVDIPMREQQQVAGQMQNSRVGFHSVREQIRPQHVDQRLPEEENTYVMKSRMILKNQKGKREGRNGRERGCGIGKGLKKFSDWIVSENSSILRPVQHSRVGFHAIRERIRPQHVDQRLPEEEKTLCYEN